MLRNCRAAKSFFTTKMAWFRMKYAVSAKQILYMMCQIANATWPIELRPQAELGGTGRPGRRARRTPAHRSVQDFVQPHAGLQKRISRKCE